MNADLYAAWLTAGNNLQPIGEWLAGGGAWLVPAIVAAVFAAWAIRQSLRDASKRVDAILADQPGTDDQLLEQCWDICPELRKETP